MLTRKTLFSIDEMFASRPVPRFECSAREPVLPRTGNFPHPDEYAYPEIDSDLSHSKKTTLQNHSNSIQINFLQLLFPFLTLFHSQSKLSRVHDPL
jgi:hypothetical protein